jgi:hypothetical protein
MSLLEQGLFGKATGLKSLLDDNNFSGMDSDFQRPATVKNPNFNPDLKSNLPDVLNTAKSETMPLNPSYQRKTSPLKDGSAFKTNILAQMDNDDPRKQKFMQSQDGIVPTQAETDEEDGITNYGKADPKGFAKMFGVSLEQMSANWKDKGGFEALMANPAFTVGAALLKSGSQGKSISAGAIDSLVTGGAISKQYADQIKKKQGLLAPVTEEQRESMKGVVGEQGITEPGLIDKMKSLFGGGNAEAMYREALDDIYVEAERLAKKDAAGSKTKVRFDPRKYGKQAIKNLQASGKLVVRKDRIYRAGTLQAKTSKIEGRAEGGPIQSGQDYVVGEKGPEMFVSETNGTIINNDDSKVVSMLLESNPQLKNVSRSRAVKILKARFPDYF